MNILRAALEIPALCLRSGGRLSTVPTGSQPAEDPLSESQLPPGLLQFIASSLPSYESAVLLVFVSREPGRDWKVEEIAESIGSDAISRREVEQYLDHFERARLLRRTGEGFRFDPASPELEQVVAELRDAYDHRPVTLIRIVRDFANARLRSFSDSFRLKED